MENQGIITGKEISDPFNFMEDLTTQVTTTEPELEDPEEIEDPIVDPEVPDPEETQEETSLDDNKALLMAMATRWKEAGGLPEDFEITEDITDIDIENAYRSLHSDSVRDEVKATEIERLKSLGYTEEDLEYSRRKRLGIPDEQLQLRDSYHYLASYQFNEDSDTYDNDVKELFYNYYIDRGLPEDEARDNALADFDKDSKDSLVERRQTYFKGQFQAEEQKILDKEAAKEEAVRKAEADKIQAMNNFLSQETIAKVKYSKADRDKARKALFEKTEKVTFPDGSVRRVTAYEKKMMQYANDPELAFKLILDFVLDKDIKVVSEEAARKAKRSLLDEMNSIKGTTSTTQSEQRSHDNQIIGRELN